ncbi:ComEC/Rec2 family competence protein [Ruminococcus sp.]|uniref:ComEC/Rec2 family competence protein n=1 Tax=Ruminococcus sp. TaxID=41978 RepID=UPI0025CE2A33|nr:ComEC/Rec2 family competence protein [Ruminococcus sp.]MCR4637701.1 MBL fold metallo-hydrolase [Ruminococcus sp.]
MAEKREKERERRKKKALNLLWLLITAAVLVFLGWRYFRKPVHTFPNEDKLVMHFIDVGQGDCTFIAANGVTMLVDCGENEVSEQVTDYLRGLGVGRLDYIIATHPHSDHMGGMYRIIDVFDVGEVLIPHIPDEQIPTAVFYERFLESCAAKNVPIEEVHVGQVLEIGSARAEIIAPDGSVYENINNYSVSFMLTHGRNKCLFTGDAEAESEAAMIQVGRLSKVMLYKAGHHGSSHSSTEELIDIIRPQTAVISCGSENPYGHPADSTVKRLERYADVVCRTDVNGTVIVESNGANINITCERAK